ncbi:MAG: hypothetical protein A3E01_18755 [Gammaproteobacteria bacterium RIFCSPHIGHO2_12_FULL_63_22]|nr:MAG: hypothetical protein A3E01_18755 [Gammaproteobacteria bacterium RIFCSPHIGHO2_12_FULL_63_22]
MAIHFLTPDPASLLKEFDARIHQTEAEGKITTWEKLEDGKHYTHKAADWKSKAYFKPSVGKDRLTFNIIRPKDKSVTVPVYGYYHGHLMETFLNHFDKKFTTSMTSALPEAGDDVTKK